LLPDDTLRVGRSVPPKSKVAISHELITAERGRALDGHSR
jgi:hypothetical protein